MRNATVFILAAALVAAPAAAQNDTNAAGVTAANDVAAVDANAAMTTNTAVEPGPLPDETAAPAPPPPARPQERGFPWGVIGLVGLVGLLGRKRRD